MNTIYPASRTRPHLQDIKEGTFLSTRDFLINNFSTLTWVLVGASIQALAVYLFSTGRYVLLLSTVALVTKLILSSLQAREVLPNPYLEGVIPGRVTSLMPNPESGEIQTASSRKIAVLHLGAKANHPFGFLAPQVRGVGEWLRKMTEDMDAGKARGCLGQTTFYRKDAKGAPEIVLISYWESIEDLWEFAHSPLHREAWQWWERTIKDNGYVGINHEIFEAEAKHWENVYVNFQPTMQGATMYLKKGDRIEGGVVPDEWVSPLVDARRGKLAKSSARMGREITKYDPSRVAKETYE